MPYKIRILTGPNEAEVYPLFENRDITIGRSPTCNIRVSDPHVSRVHCEIVESAAGCRLTDLQSTNGTFVNAERITECELEAGCEIRVGVTLLRLEEAGPAGRPPITAKMQSANCEAALKPPAPG